MPEGVPLQSLSHPPGWPTVWRSAPASRGSLPFDDVPRSGPVYDGPSGVRHGSDPGVSHPLAGFLAPLELAGLLRPAAVPGLLLPSERSPRVRSRTPRRGRCLPCRSSRSNPGAAHAVLSPLAFTDSGDVRASSLAGSCRRLEAPFQRRSSHPLPCGSWHASRRLPVTLDLARRTHLGPAVPSTSELSSLRESVHTARRSPVARRPVLSWASSPLQSLAPAKPGALTSPATAGGVPPPAGTARLSARRATPWTPVPSALLAGTSRGLRRERSAAGNPRRQVESCGDDRIIPLDPSADTEPLRPGPCCLSAAASTPMTFDARANPCPSRALDFGSRVGTHQA